MYKFTGGIVTSGLAIYDTMEYIRPEVATVCMGQAASMGSFLTAGASGKRFSLPNARIMTHQPSGGFRVKPPILRSTQRNLGFAPPPEWNLREAFEENHQTN